MDMAGLVVRLVFSLAIVLGLLLLIARFAGRRFQGRAGAPVRVLHRQPISRGSSVTVVTVGTRILVLGSTEQQVTLLTELEPDEIDLPLDEEDDAAADGDAAGRPARTVTPVPDRPLAGSILSPQTWKQALAMATRAAGVTPSGPASGPAPLSETLSEKHAS
jgi:flagellar protein FliO/FliZ